MVLSIETASSLMRTGIPGQCRNGLGVQTDNKHASIGYLLTSGSAAIIQCIAKLLFRLTGQDG